MYSKFKKGVKRTDKTNAITKYITGDFSNIELEQWKQLFKEEVRMLSEEEKQNYLLYDMEISLSSDAFMPLRDNVDIENLMLKT